MKMNPLTFVIALGAASLAAAGSSAGELTARPERKTAAAADLYTCEMHPQIRWSRADDCPLCGMPLVRANQRAQPTAGRQEGPADHAGMAMPNGSNMPMGDAGNHAAMGGCGMCMPMMGMGNMNSAAAPAGRKATGSYGSRRGGGGRGCGC